MQEINVGTDVPHEFTNLGQKIGPYCRQECRTEDYVCTEPKGHEGTHYAHSSSNLHKALVAWDMIPDYSPEDMDLICGRCHATWGKHRNEHCPNGSGIWSFVPIKFEPEPIVDVEPDDGIEFVWPD